MTVLNLLSQLEVTGAETYAEALVAELAKRGHRFLVASDTLTRPIKAAFHPIRLHRRGWLDRFKNIRSISALVRRERVDVLHAHSRASSWVGTFVSKTTGVPLITTVHGLQHQHLSRKLFPAFGRFAVCICADIRKQLVNAMGVDPNLVIVIPNGIDLEQFSPSSSEEPSSPVLMFLGRLTGPKRHVLERFMAEALGEILRYYPMARFQVVGRVDDNSEIEKIAQPLQERFGRDCVTFLGYQEDVPTILKSARLVLGSGRVALEAMALSKPVVVLGETNYLGVLTEGNFASACDSNFGDCSMKGQITFDGAGQKLGELLRDVKRCRDLGAWGREAVRAFDIRNIANAVEEVYQQCLSSRS